MGSTQPPTKFIPLFSHQEERGLGCKADNFFPPRAEVKNEWSYTSAPATRLHKVYEKNHFTSLAVQGMEMKLRLFLSICRLGMYVICILTYGVKYNDW
jgi:hypothetical protein